MYRHFTKEDIQVTIKHMATLSVSLVIGEMKMKTTMKYHYTTNGKVKIKKILNTKH